MDYTSYCFNCSTKNTDINNYFCIKNKGACENCYVKVRRNKKRGYEKPMASYWNKMKRKDELVDKSGK